MDSFKCECGLSAIALEHSASGRMYWACPIGKCRTGREGCPLKMLSWELTRQIRRINEENRRCAEYKY